MIDDKTKKLLLDCLSFEDERKKVHDIDCIINMNIAYIFYKKQLYEKIKEFMDQHKIIAIDDKINKYINFLFDNYPGLIEVFIDDPFFKKIPEKDRDPEFDIKTYLHETEFICGNLEITYSWNILRYDLFENFVDLKFDFDDLN